MKRSNKMLLLIFGILTIVMTVICVNVFVVALGKYHLRSGTNLSSYVDSVNIVTETIHADRGKIYDANGIVVAQDESTYNIICFMDKSRIASGNQIAYVDDIDYTARVLATVLQADEQEICSILNDATDKYQTELGLIGKNISSEEKKVIEEYNLTGVEFVESVKRNYPLGEYFAPYLVGFAQIDENNTLVGKMGIESYLNAELSGIDGSRTYQADKNGYILQGMQEVVEDATNGYDVYLTLDSVIQDLLATCINETVEATESERVWGAVMEIDTGKILAWGQSPNFDPNKLNIDDYNNLGSQYVYEPGSVFKPITYAAAIDSGKYDGNKLVDSSPFCYTSDGNNNPVRTYGDAYGCIYNYELDTWGMVPYDYGVIYSSNTITSSVLSEVLGPDLFLEYLDRFKIFEDVDTDGIPETQNSIQFSYPVDKLTASYGQGVTVSMLKLMQAYTAILGDGTMVKPYIIDKIVDSYDENKVIYEGSTEVVGNPIKESTAKYVQDLMERAVSDPLGQSRSYELDNMKIMAKTGTTEIAQDGEYSDSGKVIYSVMIGFPYEDPQYMIYFAYEDYQDGRVSEPVKKMINNIAIMTNLKTSDHESAQSTIKDFTMPQLTNYPLDYAKNKLSEYSDNVVVIGNGNVVIDQYPKYGDTTYSNQKIFLLTSDDGFEMIDLTGYTRKEVMQLWQLTGIAFRLDGYGIVTAQSIPVGTKVTKKDVIEVKFADPPKE